MTKRSKITLLAGGIVIVLGIVFCIVGSVMANKAGDKLFAEKTDRGSVYTYEFDGGNVDRMTIDVCDAVVNVIGGSEKSYIELCNFDENYYTFNLSNRIVKLSESRNIQSVLRFWENGLTFKGMRYIFKLGSPDGEKAVNIYLTDKDAVKNFTISCGKGKINISNLSTSTDYNLTLDNGSVSMENITTDSIITVSSTESTDCRISLNNISATSVNIKAAKADVTAEKLNVNSGTVDVSMGSAKIDFLPKAEYFTVNVTTGGKLTVNNTSYIDTYRFEKLPTATASDENTAASTAPESVPSLNITGRDLAVSLTGECFNKDKE